MTGLLLLCFGPLLITVVVVVGAFGVFAPEGEAVQRSVLAGSLIAFPALSSAAAAGVLCRWCFPHGDWRGAGLACSQVAILGLLASPEYLSLVAFGRVAGSPVEIVIKAARELSFGLGLALVAVMGIVVLIELPIRLAVSSLNRGQDAGFAHSMRCAVSLLVVSMGWLLLEESAVERIRNLILAVRG